jgi:rhodanese-related sulfurtransferase
MKTLITTAVLLGTVLSRGAFAAEAAQDAQRRERAGSNGQAQQNAAAFKKLTRAEFDALVKEPGAVLVLDVRRPDEVQTIGGFPVYLSIQAGDVEKYLAFIPKDRPIVTVSNHAARAGRAATLLEKNGFKIVGAIGAQDYEGEGGTLVRVAAVNAERRSAR